jgi:DUF2407 C-terminal domain
MSSEEQRSLLPPVERVQHSPGTPPEKQNTELHHSTYDDEDDLDKGRFSPGTLTLRIQESSSRAAATGVIRTVTVLHHDTVATLKRAVVAATATPPPDPTCPNRHNPYVRLIAAGRLLAPDAATLDRFALRNDQVVHAVIVQRTDEDDSVGTPFFGGAQAVLQQGEQFTAADNTMTARALRATGVNAAGWAVRRDPNEDEDDDDDVIFHRDDNDGQDDDGILEDGTNATNAVVDLESGRPTRARRVTASDHNRMPLGFDRLRVTAGLSRAEIAVMRIYFGSQMDRWLLQHPAVNQVLQQQEPVDTLRRRRLQEEAWMEAQGPASEFRLNLNLHAPSTTQQMRWAAASASSPQEAAAVYRNSVTGSSAVVGTDRDFCWGFLLGFFVGFFMLLWVFMPTVPHKQKLGILTGYSFHLALGMLKAGNKDDEEYVDDVVLLGD